MKYYNSNKYQVTVRSTNNPEKVYYFPAKATLTVKEVLKDLPDGVREVKATTTNNNKK